MSRGARSAAKSTAQEMVQTRGAPAALDDFLAGYTADTAGAHITSSHEGALVMHIKLMSKSSDITKQKSLREINTLVEAMDEDTLSRYVLNLINTISKHSHYPNPTIRCGVFTVLHSLMRKGKGVKQAMLPELPALSGPWMMAMQDSDTATQQEATAAFHTAFSPEKRIVMLLNYKDHALTYAFEKISSILENSAALSDSEVDCSINSLYAALRALGYLIKQISASQAAVMSYLESSQILQKLIPQSRKSGGKDKHVVASPLVRSAILSLLRDVVTFCPSTPNIHQLVARALDGSILDLNPFTAKRVWELLLFWCRAGGSSIVGYFSPHFLDSVVDSIMKCQSEELADIIFPSLFPLLTQLSKDSRCAGVVDEFCGALIEKIHIHTDSPTLSTKELSVISKALMSCWELHTVRKLNTVASKESVELFTVIVLNFSELLAALSRHQRYLEAITTAVATSLLKTLIRSEDVFLDCMRVLCASNDAPFSVFPAQEKGSSASLSSSKECFAMLQSATIGHMCQEMVKESTYSRWLNLMENYFKDFFLRRLDNDDAVGAAMMYHFAGSFSPGLETMARTVEWLIKSFELMVDDSSSKNTEKVNDEAEKMQAYKELVDGVLHWKTLCPELELTPLVAVAQQPAIPSRIQERVQVYMMQDAGKLLTMLLNACEHSEFADIERYIRHMKLEESTILTSVEKKRVMVAIKKALHDEFTNLSVASEAGGADEDPREENSQLDEIGSEASDSDLNNSDAEMQQRKKKASPPQLGASACSRLVKWSSLLHWQTGPVGSLLGEDGRGEFFELIGQEMLLLLAAVAPCLYPEYYLSSKALRIALEDADDDLYDAIDAKMHFVTAQQFQDATEKVSDTLTSAGVSKSLVDEWYETFWNRLVDGESEGEGEEGDDSNPVYLLAVHQLQQLLALASPALLVAIVSSVEVWEAFRVTPVSVQDMECLFDGHYAVDQLEISFYPTIRTAQMIRLMDYCASHSHIPDTSTTSVSGEAEAKKRATRLYLLLRAAMFQEVFSSSICTPLYKLTRMMFVRLTSASAVEHLVELIRNSEEDIRDQLICTVGAVILVTAESVDSIEKVSFHAVIKVVVGRLTEFILEQTFSAESAKEITPVQVSYYSIFFQLLDRAADALQKDILSPINQTLLDMFTGMCAQLPSFGCLTVRVSLILHRHLEAKPELGVSAVKALIQYAQRQSIMDGLEVLAELSCCRILDPIAFGELVRSIMHSLCRCYSLKHLPTNGRLMRATPQHQASGTGTNFKHLWRVVLSAVTARRGVVLHSRMDDVLRGTVNLIIFDCVCECVSHLRSTNKKDVPLLARLIASTVEFLDTLVPEDVGVLRASESSTHTTAQMFVFLYLWLSAAPVQKLETIGMDIVAGAMRAACHLANLSLVRSGVTLVAQIDPIISKLPTRPIRTKFSAAEPMKLRGFVRQNTLLRKTHKHKLALFPYLLGWGIFLTNTVQTEEWAQLITRTNICTLMDIIFILMQSPMISGSSRAEDTFIGSALAEEDDGESSVLALQRADTLRALTHIDAQHVMENLARGSDAVFRLLLDGKALGIVKDWMSTVEKRVQQQVSQFVARYISKISVEKVLKEVLSHSEEARTKFSLGENMTVEVNMVNSYVGLEYEVEGEHLVVRISFPGDYPLSPPKVDYRNEKEYGVSWKKWRSWMMRMTAKLFGGGTNVWDCIVLFQRNVDAHFEGLEPCPICFAVVSAVDNRVPEMVCSVCHNSKFHGSCLYTWWANGGSNVCPLCRSPWVA